MNAKQFFTNTVLPRLKRLFNCREVADVVAELDSKVEALRKIAAEAQADAAKHIAAIEKATKKREEALSEAAKTAEVIEKIKGLLS